VSHEASASGDVVVEARPAAPIPINQPLPDGNEAKYPAECVETGWISSEGPFVARLERGMAEACGGGVASFYPNKHGAKGEGGMVLTGDDALDARCRALRNLCFGKDALGQAMLAAAQVGDHVG